MAKVGTIGLSGLHLAKRNEITNDVVAESALQVDGLVSAEVEIDIASESIYADDVVADVITAYAGGTVTVELLGLSLEEYAMVTGHEVVDGVVLDNVNTIAPLLAMTFKSQKSNGKYRYVSLPQVKANVKGESFHSKEDGVEVANIEVEFSIIPMENGVWRLRADEDVCTNTAFINSFLTSFPEELPAVVTTSAKAGK
ncbi:MAG: major tail protein [Paraclostridium sp.]